MEKQKTYKNIKFPSNILRSTRELLEKQTKDDEVREVTWSLSIRVSETERWKFDSEDEFFAAYRDSVVSATYFYQLGVRSISMELYKDETTIAVSAPLRAEIEAIFHLFEEAVPNSFLLVETAAARPSHFSELPGFELEKKLPSCHVDRKLIERLQRFCIQELPKIIHADPEAIKDNYTISIVDSAGTEELLGIDAYGVDCFTDTVSRVALSVNYMSSSELYFRLSVTFDKDRIFSKFNIHCKSDKPRELAHSVAEGLNHRISPSKTLNYVYYPPDVIEGVLFGFLIPLFAVSTLLLLKGYTISALFCFLSWALLLIYITVAKKWNGYTTFESQLQARRSANWRWLFYGVLSFVIFSTLLAFLRKQLIGF